MSDRIGKFDLARALADTALIHSPSTLEDALDAIVHAARVSVPGFQHVGLTVVQADGQVTTMAATGDLAAHLDSVQHKLGQGPCVNTLRGEPLVVVENLRQEQRWPRYTPRAVEAGVRAQMSIQLSTFEETLGGLNFYATMSDGIDPEAAGHAELFAAHTALAIRHAREKQDLTDAVENRQLIGQAIGILTERYEITGDRAFHYLARMSAAAEITILDVAKDVVDQANVRAVTAAEADD